jgi:hypothetical protein
MGQRKLLHVLQHGQIISEDQTNGNILFVVGCECGVEEWNCDCDHFTPRQAFSSVAE